MFHKQHLMNDGQNEVQIFSSNQKLDHIVHNRSLSHFFSIPFPQSILEISAYKDPVENQVMKKILDRIITGFFVVVLGSLWYCSTKCHVKPQCYTIIIYDIFGKQIKIDEIRTEFKTQRVAQSYISEYRKRFSHYDFSIALEIPEMKRRLSIRNFKRIQM